ncbi:hypothetical protein IMG5_095240 [Ichthyophthirius multifiliis]|uniref:Aldehyde dehydrogenase domain-containing protein n=1 Tax=Ichthyophthirius multifiliis TaxID=5932 RepID=G0QRM9_ICHMU|nr:hypothetical protein IMG5_095240 [Ichthyophthirius multifiliis]EGR32128.1 hypothetical protein IMG5_095240 [Ichthyophthirius multifiliis]|eukprot:XP_004035614.1 hypothetical protein IMG5_095240 [Ichthyophthirius multifiliis]
MIRKFISCSPLTNEIIKEFDFITDSQLQNHIELSLKGYSIQKNLSFQQKYDRLHSLTSLIDQNFENYAKIITTETGKPITQSIAEVQKSSAHCKYIIENLDKLYKSERIKTEAKKSMILYQPLGIIHYILPFNFPFWFIFKGMISALSAGNSALVRVSDSTPLVGLAVQELFQKAGFDHFEYQNVFTSPSQLELICKNRHIKGIAFTGSTKTGSQIAQMAGKYIKKSTLELGGNDPFIVCEDADIDLAVNLAIKSRLANAGLQKVKIGNPFLAETELGPLARIDLLQNLEAQIEKSVQQGAKIAFGGNRCLQDVFPKGNFFQPTVLENINSNNIANQEEIFGPVFSVFKVKNIEEAIQIANDSRYGLGACIVSKDLQKAEEIAKQIETGTVYVNDFVRSDSRLPIGGIKDSGYGRECGYHGALEFTNIKSMWIK